MHLTKEIENNQYKNGICTVNHTEIIIKNYIIASWWQVKWFIIIKVLHFHIHSILPITVGKCINSSCCCY